MEPPADGPPSLLCLGFVGLCGGFHLAPGAVVSSHKVGSSLIHGMKMETVTLVLIKEHLTESLLLSRMS